MRKIVQEYSTYLTEYLVEYDEDSNENIIKKVQMQGPLVIEIEPVPSFVKINNYRIRDITKKDEMDENYIQAKLELDDESLDSLMGLLDD